MEGIGIKISFIFIDIILPLVVGYICKKKDWLSSRQYNVLIRFNIIVVMTILTLLSFWILPLRAELAMLPVFSFLNVLLPWGLVKLSGRHKKFSSLTDQGSYLIVSMPANIGSLAGLCGFILYGELSFAYVQIVGVFQNLVMLFVLFPMAYYYKYSSEHGGAVNLGAMNWRALFLNWNQLSVAGIIVGMILYSFDVPRPQILGDFFQFLIHFSAWAALVPIGYMIEFTHLQTYCRQTLDIIPVKMIITPLVLYLVGTLFFSDAVLLGTLIIMMAAPCAINSLITARLYGLNVNLAMAPFITTTVVYVFVLYPLFYILVAMGILPFR